MKKMIYVLLIAVFAASCQKEIVQPKLEFNFPKTAEVTYKIYGRVYNTKNLPKYERKISYLYGWTKNDSGVVYLYKDTIVTGNFQITFEMNVLKVDGYYSVPTDLYWKSTDGNPSITVVDRNMVADNGTKGHMHAAGSCPDLERPSNRFLMSANPEFYNPYE